MDDGPTPSDPAPKDSPTALLESLQAVFHQPLSRLQEDLESFRDRQPEDPCDPIRQHLGILIQVCSDLRGLSWRGLDLAPPEARLDQAN